MLMLQSVIRSSIDSAVTASPVNSRAWPVPPAQVISPITASARSFAVTPGARCPRISTRIVFGFTSARHCVASTCSTSDVPIPNASAPKAPCVVVWLSPHTIVMPGCVSPCSGPITWTMPWAGESRSCSVMPWARQWVRRASICAAASWSVSGR